MQATKSQNIASIIRFIIFTEVVLLLFSENSQYQEYIIFHTDTGAGKLYSQKTFGNLHIYYISKSISINILDA